MTYYTPGIFADGEAVGEKRARTEILAEAFNDAAGEYFDRQHQYEQALEAAKERKARMQNIGIVAAIFALFFLIIGASAGSVQVIALGVGVGLVGCGYAYMQFQNAKEEIERQQQNLEYNQPDGSVSFVSQIAVPFYLVPYDEQHMIFDGLRNAPETSITLSHIDGEAVLQQRDELENTVDYYEEAIEGEAVLQPKDLDDIDFDVRSHRQLERPIAKQIDDITEVVRDTETETVSVSVHANNTVSKSIRQLAQQNQLRENGGLSVGPTRISLSECENIVTDMRGFEDEAASGDILDQMDENRKDVMKLTQQFVDRLENNQRTVDTHFDSYGNIQQLAAHKHVCRECFDQVVKRVENRYDLVEEVLSSETGSFGEAMGDEDLGEEFENKIKNDIREQFPELSEDLRRAFNTLPDISDSQYCGKHEHIETVAVHQSGQLFGPVWRNLYYAFRDPILERARDLEKDAEDVRQSKEQKMIDLEQLKQTRDSIESEYQKVDAQYQTAKKIEGRI